MEKPFLNVVVPDERPPLPAWSVLTVLCGVSFTTNVIISLIAPIVPQHLHYIGVHGSWNGLIFSGFPFAMLVFSPLAMVAMGRCGRMGVLVFGLVLQGVSTVAFGYADQMTGGEGENADAAVAVFLSCRLLCGFGGAFSNNAIFAIATDRFPDRLGEVMALNEVIIGFAFSTGPAISSLLYLAGGFPMPFVVMGTAALLFSPVALLLKQPPLPEDAEAVEGGFCDVLTPGLLIAGGCVILGTGVFGVVEPLLGRYLEDKLGVPKSLLGLMFVTLAAPYSLAGPVVGRLADQIGALWVCLFGCFGSGCVMALMLGALSKGLPDGTSNHIWYEAVSLALLGITQAAVLIPGLPAMKDGAKGRGHQNTDAVVTVFNMFMQVGLTTAPVISTTMSEYLGFEGTCGVCGACVAVYASFGVVYAVRHRRNFKAPGCETPKTPKSPFGFRSPSWSKSMSKLELLCYE